MSKALICGTSVNHGSVTAEEAEYPDSHELSDQDLKNLDLGNLRFLKSMIIATIGSVMAQRSKCVWP